MYSCGPPHMDVQKQDDQHELTYSNYVRTQDVTLKTCRRRWMIGRSGERGSGISVLAARHDDDDDHHHHTAQPTSELRQLGNDKALCSSFRLFTFLPYWTPECSIHSKSFSLCERQPLIPLQECSFHMGEHIHCHPQTDCFVVSQLFSVARHVGRLKIWSKHIYLSSHWVPLSYGLVPHLSKKLSKFTYIFIIQTGFVKDHGLFLHDFRKKTFKSSGCFSYNVIKMIESVQYFFLPKRFQPCHWLKTC